MKSGIYKIYCENSRKSYYGSSFDVEKRMQQHKRNFINGNSHNQEMQNDFNKYGMDSFSFTFYKACEDKNLSSEEERVLSAHNKKFLYNSNYGCTRKSVRSSNKTTSIMIPEEVYNTIMDRADHEERSFSNMVTRLLKTAI